MKISEQHGFGFWLGWGTFMIGWADALSDQPAEGVAQMREGLRVWRDTGSELGQSYFLALLAETTDRVGAMPGGTSLLDEAQSFAKRTDERFWQAELHRLRGELVLRDTGGPSEAESHFRRALEVSRAQGARSLELRAATSFARLQKHHGTWPEGRSVLEAVCKTFPADVETADLQAARSVLAQSP